MSNRKRYPEAWNFFETQARNITQEHNLKHLGNYRIPKPNRSGDFIYADNVENLWVEFIKSWYNPDINSESTYGKIQFITQNF